MAKTLLHIKDRIKAYTKITKGCHLWVRSVDKSGYGRISINYKLYGVHRIVYELTYGAFNKELHVLHKCDNPRCINPDHLFLGTNQDNMTDRNNKKRQIMGSKVPMSKLNEEIVLLLRKNYDPTDRNYDAKMAKKYNVSRGTIYFVRTKRTWKHVGGK